MPYAAFPPLKRVCTETLLQCKHTCLCMCLHVSVCVCVRVCEHARGRTPVVYRRSREYGWVIIGLQVPCLLFWGLHLTPLPCVLDACCKPVRSDQSLLHPMRLQTMHHQVTKLLRSLDGSAKSSPAQLESGSSKGSGGEEEEEEEEEDPSESEGDASSGGEVSACALDSMTRCTYGVATLSLCRVFGTEDAHVVHFLCRREEMSGHSRVFLEHSVTQTQLVLGPVHASARAHTGIQTYAHTGTTKHTHTGHT